MNSELLKQKEQIIKAVRGYGLILNFLSEKWKNDRDVALEAIKENSRAFDYISEALKDNKELLSEAFKKSDFAIDYFSDDMKNSECLLEILEKVDISCWNNSDKKWHENKMESLNNIRRKEDKAIIESNIVVSNKVNKKNKF